MSNRDPLIGQQFGNYLIQQPLGRGGMARVYKGLDVSLKRPVAIKVIEESLRASATYAQRFEREAQAVASLKHPNIVTVFHFGKQESLYYLVMEYIDGTDLDAIMRNYENNGELMPHPDVIRILGAIGSALDYAHTQGVIHRDVKPSNIMLEKNGRPVLTDFGLALRVKEGTVGDTFGSPHYISPEQAKNSANAVPQSDLYSLAVIAYELLVGVVPFDDPTPTALAMQHILAPVPPPCAFNRNLPEDVDGVLFKALAKTPDERYQTSQEFITALQGALQHSPGKVATAELPPLPPGVMPPPPRRLSMQTALDKVGQEVALAQAKGQSLTRQPMKSNQAKQVPITTTDATIPSETRPSFMPYVIAGIGAILALIVVGLALNAIVNHPSAVPTVAVLPSPTIALTLIPAPTTAIAAIKTASPIPPTATLKPSATLPPPTVTATHSLTPTVTLTFTPLPSPTPLPPSPTIAPTNVPVQPTQPGAAPAQTAAPTVLYPNGLLLVFIWDTNAFYAANESGQKILTTNLSFDRVLDNGQFTDHFAGSRWALNYPYSEPNHCLILNIQGKAWRLPTSDCPSGYNSQLYAFNNEIFWTPADGSSAFRVLWQGKEIGRCLLSQNRCEQRLPLG